MPKKHCLLTVGATVDHVTHGCAPPELNDLFLKRKNTTEVRVQDRGDRKFCARVEVTTNALCSVHLLNDHPAADVGIVVSSSL